MIYITHQCIVTVSEQTLRENTSQKVLVKAKILRTKTHRYTQLNNNTSHNTINCTNSVQYTKTNKPKDKYKNHNVV